MQEEKYIKKDGKIIYRNFIIQTSSVFAVQSPESDTKEPVIILRRSTWGFDDIRIEYSSFTEANEVHKRILQKIKEGCGEINIKEIEIEVNHIFKNKILLEQKEQEKKQETDAIACAIACVIVLTICAVITIFILFIL